MGLKLNQSKEYSASLGISALITTATITLLLVAIVTTIVMSLIPPFHAVNVTIAGLSTILICGLYLIAYLLHPIKYILDDKKIVVKRHLRTVNIFLSEIQDVYIVNKETMTDVERVGGSRGLFGYFGEFKTRFGIATFYATRMDKFILVTTAADEKIVLTPDNLSFYYDVKDAIHSSSHRLALKLFE
jgi:hypothetical protein